ncbi:hypothetical protein [Streptomyces sp. NBC_01500]|uniref:hypothetical protein n=1 Tax=unclassified Streptomyces TaxID=2593676 RepID=UPI00338FA38E
MFVGQRPGGGPAAMACCHPLTFTSMVTARAWIREHPGSPAFTRRLHQVTAEGCLTRERPGVGVECPGAVHRPQLGVPEVPRGHPRSGVHRTVTGSGVVPSGGAYFGSLRAGMRLPPSAGWAGAVRSPPVVLQHKGTALPSRREGPTLFGRRLFPWCPLPVASQGEVRFRRQKRSMSHVLVSPATVMT